jgi:hypothetical protein
LRGVLIANTIFLIGLAVVSFSLPLSEFERWLVVSTVTILAAVDLAAVERLRSR